MSSSIQVLALFLFGVILVNGDGQDNADGKPTTAVYEYGTSQGNLGQWTGSPYAYPGRIAGAQRWRAGTNWPYSQGQYNPTGSSTWNANPYQSHVYGSNAPGYKYNTLGSTPYPQNPYGYGNLESTPYPQNRYGYGNYGGQYNPAYGNKYQAVPSGGSGRTWTAGGYGSQYNTPWMMAYGPSVTGYSNPIGANGYYSPYRNNGYQLSPTVSTPSTGLAATTPKYSLGTAGLPSTYSPYVFGGTGYGPTGYNSIGYGAAGQDYNAKYGAGFKPWMMQDGKIAGGYGYQATAKPVYQNYFSPGMPYNQYGAAKTGYAQ